MRDNREDVTVPLPSRREIRARCQDRMNDCQDISRDHTHAG